MDEVRDSRARGNPRNDLFDLALRPSRRLVEQRIVIVVREVRLEETQPGEVHAPGPKRVQDRGPRRPARATAIRLYATSSENPSSRMQKACIEGNARSR